MEAFCQGRRREYTCLATSRAIPLAAKLNKHLNGQRRVFYDDLGNELGLVYAEEFIEKDFVVHTPKLAA